MKILPAMHTPTVSDLADAGWIAIEVIIDEKVVRHICRAQSARAPAASSNTP